MAALPSLSDITKVAKVSLTIEAQEKIMELRRGAMDLQDQNLQLWEKVSSLEAEVRRLSSPSLPPCPKCGQHAYSLESSKPDPMMGVVGVQLRTHRCGACGFSETTSYTGREGLR